MRIGEYDRGARDVFGNPFKMWAMKSDDPKTWRAKVLRPKWEEFLRQFDEIHVRSGASQNRAGGLVLKTDANKHIQVRLTGYRGGVLVW